jgi:hypothetical protein
MATLGAVRRKIMKILAIATTLGLVVLVGAPAQAQYGAPPPALPPVPIYTADGQPPPVPTVVVPSPLPVAQPLSAIDADTDDEDGYDIDYDVYYDTAAAENYDDGYDPQAYQQFQSTLAPYGDWVDDPTYGEIWAPSAGVVGDDFSPYGSDGNWSLTEYGWTWVSNYDWGWAPFHYGRWVDRLGYGWCWVPGSVWGPGWVSWRSGGGYAGWAPLPPRGVTVGAPRGVRSPWRFMLAHELGQKRPFLPSHVVPAIFAKTSVVTNLRTANAGGMAVRFNAGPSAGAIHAQVGQVPLRNFAMRAMPRPAVTPRAGIPLQARPWVRPPVQGGVQAGWAPRNGPIPLRAVGPGPHSISIGQPMMRPQTVMSRPVYQSRPMNGSLTVVRPGGAPMGYGRPAYSAPAYHYSAPVNQYSTPAYHYSAPAYHYSAPANQYSAPAYHYSAPSYQPAPAAHFSAPSSGGRSFGGGGGGRHR